MIKFLLLFLAALLAATLFSNCVNLPAPHAGFVMHCDVCGRLTDWGVLEDYFYCGASGTVWDLARYQEVLP